MNFQNNNCLIFGFDDSNHSGNFGDEYIVAAISRLPGDSTCKSFKNRRDFSVVNNFLEKSGKDYFFTRLSHNDFSKNRFNLPLVAPFFVDYFVQGLPEEEKPRKIFLFFDGPLKEKWKSTLEKDLKDFSLEVDSFTGDRKRNCPEVVYVADVLSNALYRDFKEGVYTSTDKEISLDKKALNNRRFLFKK